jgi:hypothetical protein
MLRCSRLQHRTAALQSVLDDMNHAAQGRTRQMILYTSVQFGWPKNLLMSPGAGEQNTAVC